MIYDRNAGQVLALEMFCIYMVERFEENCSTGIELLFYMYNLETFNTDMEPILIQIWNKFRARNALGKIIFLQRDKIGVKCDNELGLKI